MPSEGDIVKTLKRTNSLLFRYVDPKHVFFRGILTGLGGLIGATLILGLLLWFLSQLEFVPIVGNFISDIVNFLERETNSLSDF